MAKTDEAQLRGVAVEWLVVQTCIRQQREIIERRKRELERAFEELTQSQRELQRLERQNGILWKWLTPQEQQFIAAYDENGQAIGERSPSMLHITA